MGRRSLSDPIAIRQEAAKQLRTLLEAFDLAELQAQTYAISLVDMIAGIALSTTIKPDELPVLQFKCDQAHKLLARAYGSPTAKASVTLHKAEDLAPGSKISSDIADATRAAEEYRQMLGYLGQPFDTWPDWMRERFQNAPATIAPATIASDASH